MDTRIVIDKKYVEKNITMDTLILLLKIVIKTIFHAYR